MEKEGKLLSHVLVLGVGSVLSKLTVFLMLPLYTAALSPAEFGTVDILVNTAVLLLPVASLHAPEAVFRFAAGGEEEGAVLAVGRLLLRVGLGLFLLLLPLLGFFEVLRPYLLYLFLYVSFSVLHSYFAHILRARGQYGFYAVQQLFCTLATVLLAFLFLPILRLGARGYLMAILFADALTALILFFYLHAGRAWRAPKPHFTLLRPMLRYALPLIPTGTLWWLLAVFDRYVLLAFHGETATGLYAAAGKLPALLTFAAGIFLEAWHFAAIHEREEGRRALFERIYGALIPMLILMTLSVILCSRLLVEHVFAADFEQAALYVPLLSVAAFFSALSSFLGSVYMVKLRSGASLMTALLGAAVNVALCFLWIPSRGVVGAMAATLIAYVTVFVWRAVHCHRVMPFCQYAGKLTASSLCLVLTALLVMLGVMVPAFLTALLAILPFYRELMTSFLLLVHYTKKFLRISTKKTDRS